MAQAFLELAKHAFAEFSGREPDSTPEIPTLPTVIIYMLEEHLFASEWQLLWCGSFQFQKLVLVLIV